MLTIFQKYPEHSLQETHMHREDGFQGKIKLTIKYIKENSIINTFKKCSILLYLEPK